MKSTPRASGRVAVLMAVACFLSPSLDAQAPDLSGDLAAAIPAGNPYRAVLASYVALGSADRRGGEAADAAGRSEAIRALAAQLAAVDASAAGAREWDLVRNAQAPLDPQGIKTPEVDVLRPMTRELLAVSRDLPPAEATALQCALLRLGDNYIAGADSFIQRIVGVGLTNAAMDVLASRSSKLSSSELSALGAAIDATSAQDQHLDVMMGEFNNYLLPVLIKLRDAALKDAATEVSSRAVDTQLPEFAARLRFSSYLQLPNGEFVLGFEDANGAAFQLGPSTSHEGIAVVDIDFARQTAVLAKDGERAMLKLASREIVAERKWGPAYNAAFKEVFGESSNNEWMRGLADQLLQGFMEHPEGPNGHFTQINRSIEIAMQIAANAALQAKLGEPKIDSALPIINAMADGFIRVGRLLQARSVKQALLREGLRLHAQGSEATSVDPWSTEEANFSYEKLPEGGFRLSSAYEGRSSKPVSLDFK